MQNVDAARVPPLYGLVLAGGRGTRLGRDKGELEYHGVPQVRWAFTALQAHCAAVRVSLREDQRSRPVYADLPAVVDLPGAGGPAAGLLAALRFDRRAAWLLLAADMPRVDTALLAQLVAARDPTVLATAFRHSDGTPEPLCAIWEPAVFGLLEAGPADRVSLRRLLEAGPARLVVPTDAAGLASVNTAADDAAARTWLAAGSD